MGKNNLMFKSCLILKPTKQIEENSGTEKMAFLNGNGKYRLTPQPP
jgi:hypothetical protein